MVEEIIVAGAGGQGVLVLGKVIAVAAIQKGLKTTWLPSYGPEMRGGTANCSVVISSDEVGSPMVEEPTLLICFNQPSIAKFGPTVASGGLILANEDTINDYPALKADVELVKVPVNTIALSLGNEKMINMVMLGSLLKKRNIVEYDGCVSALKEIWGPEKAEKLLPMNLKAIQSGMEAVAK